MNSLLNDPDIASGLKLSFEKTIKQLEKDGTPLSSSEMFKYTSFYTGDIWKDDQANCRKKAA